jgi:RNA polymerase sigma-70 factor (ECF subfamily)
VEFYDFDDDYLARLRDGDFRTQEHFVAYFSELLQIKLRSRFLPQDVEDIRQETFVRFFRALRKEDGIRDAKCLGSFVISMCRNVAREHGREPHFDQADDIVLNGFPDRKKSAIDIVLTQEQQEMVREVLDSLPERDRRILRAVFLSEEDKDQVCKEFGVTRDNLRVLVWRAFRKFREKMPKKPPGRAAAD